MWTAVVIMLQAVKANQKTFLLRALKTYIAVKQSNKHFLKRHFDFWVSGSGMCSYCAFLGLDSIKVYKKTALHSWLLRQDTET